MNRAEKPLLVFDGECGFCRAWVERWRHDTGGAVDAAPFQEVAARFPEVPVERFREAVHLLEADGVWTRGAEAVFRSLAYARGHGRWLWLYAHLPGFAAVSEWGYRQVARHRTAAAALTRLLWGRHVIPPGEALTAWIFLRLLGLVFAIALASLGVQVIGLAGERGILPAANYLRLVAAQLGPGGPWFAPSLLWLGGGDAMLQALCWVGAALSLLLALGVAAGPSLLGAWICTLSLASVCQNFLWFQWDGLLLEAGFIALFFVPWRWWSRPGADPPPRAALRLARWLLFRLMFASALVKLTSGDPSWRNLTALEYHYQTQPLPTWTAWYAHQLPAWFQRFSVVVMFAIEGLAPFLIVGPRRVRFVAAGALVGLQVLIAATGNYAYFNLLALALCVLLLDDGVWPRRAEGGQAEASAESRPRARTAPGWLVVPVAVVLVLLSLVPLSRAFHSQGGFLGPIRDLYRVASPFRIVNPYGLFQVMTTRRPEIVIEGSADGLEWKPYAFRWKPGDPDRRPEFVAPHQPRLDWQMWFAALSDFRQESWFLSFCRRLLEGSPPVRALLARDPFPGRPPRFVRAVLYEYRFADPATRHATGAWWTRERLGLYCPVLMLDQGRLTPVELRAPGGR